MREVYIGRTIVNFFFLMQAQLYTKLLWLVGSSERMTSVFCAGAALPFSFFGRAVMICAI